jgi:hypothetical protein
MSKPIPQFKAHLVFTFADNKASQRDWFSFDEGKHRRVPMAMETVEGLHTVCMWIETAAKFHAGDEIDVDCVVIWPEGFREAVVPGRKFKLWDGGFFADGEVTHRIEEGWPDSTKAHG